MMLGMEDLSSECSSGCQSGWTMYLDQSSYSNSFHCKNPNSFDRTIQRDDEEEEEDLSMVSDASSGPSPLLHEDEHYQQQNTIHDNLNYAKKMKKKMADTKKYKKKISPSYLDDTASSHFDYTKSYSGAMNPAMETMRDFSCAVSTNHFNESEVCQNDLCYFQSPSLIKPVPQRPVSKEGGKKMW